MSVRTGWTTSLAFVVPACLVVGLFISFGHIGYSPSDEGNILAQTYRILHGQVPQGERVTSGSFVGSYRPR